MEKTLATDADMLKRILNFCKNHDVRPTTFGRQAVGDGSLVANLEAGRSLTLKMANRVDAYMREAATGCTIKEQGVA